MAAPAAPPLPPLADAQGRRITYLRLSLTDRCNFRCSYCALIPPGGAEEPSPPVPRPLETRTRGEAALVAGGPPAGLRSERGALSREHIARLVHVFAGLGVRRVRLTGGEPTLRRDLLDVVRDVRGTPGIEEVALTTNGHLLDTLAAPLRAAGVSRLNVSLDTLDPERLRRISGRAATLDRIVAGLEEALRGGFDAVKLNVVVVAGENEDELGELTRFAWRLGATPRFIELMPFGAGEPVPIARVKALLAEQGVRLAPDATRGWGPATHMRGSSEADGRAVSGLVGFIGAMTEGFCDGCNRVRVAADGSLRPCLGGRERLPLAKLLAAGASDAELEAGIRAALLAKGECHDMAGARGGLPSMKGTGG